MKRILTCVGTRPNLIKISKLQSCISNYDNLEHKLLHTGQHFDHQMNEIFFKQLGMKEPDVFLNIQGSGQIQVIAEIMKAFEKELLEIKPDLVLVPGDVNSSLACALVAQRHGIPVGHIESGLRSGDMTMPEEVNRILIDELSSIFFITEKSGQENLEKLGKDKSSLVFTGNTMIDSLELSKEMIAQSSVLDELKLKPKEYALVTFHRPQNVDRPEDLQKVIDILKMAANKIHVVFPMHPRTRKNLEQFGMQAELDHPNITTVGPLGYIDFMSLIQNSRLVLTDSGGVQEETTYLEVPCLTVRPNTERPITIELGTNTLVNLDVDRISSLIDDIIQGSYKSGSIPPMWDGNATERMVKAINDFLS